jgi:hypothetical protein
MHPLCQNKDEKFAILFTSLFSLFLLSVHRQEMLAFFASTCWRSWHFQISTAASRSISSYRPLALIYTHQKIPGPTVFFTTIART